MRFIKITLLLLEIYVKYHVYRVIARKGEIRLLEAELS